MLRLPVSLSLSKLRSQLTFMRNQSVSTKAPDVEMINLSL
jgi:hypothetical protein